MSKLPIKLAKLRKHYHYSQADVASGLGIDVFRYMAYENGRTLPDFDLLLKMADFYRIKADELFVDHLEVHLYPYKHKEKNKYLCFLKKEKKKILAGASLVLFLLLVYILVPKKSAPEIERITANQSKLDASATFVVYQNKDGKLVGSGDNGNGQLEVSNIQHVLQVETGSTFTVILTSDHRVHTIGLLSKYAKEVEQWEDIVDIEVGKAHILGLSSDGKVYCVGDNFYGQCSFRKQQAQAIYAKENASIVVVDGAPKVFGEFRYTKELERLRHIHSIDFNDSVVAYIDQDKKVGYLADASYDVADFKDVDKVVVGDGFIAAKIGKQVKIAIDNYVIAQEVESWIVDDIVSGGDYLVGYYQGEIKGVGNNRFNQFEKSDKDLQQLPTVENIKVDLLEKDIKIQFDRIAIADYYQVELDAGIGLNVRTDNNYVYIPFNKLQENQEYTIRIVAFSKNKNYQKSNTAFFKWTYVKPVIETVQTDTNNDTVVTIEIPFHLETLLGKTVTNFDAYLKGLGIPEENITKVQSNQACSSEHKEAIVVAVSGIIGGEEVKSSELKTRKIEYEYCKVE